MRCETLQETGFDCVCVAASVGFHGAMMCGAWRFCSEPGEVLIMRLPGSVIGESRWNDMKPVNLVTAAPTARRSWIADDY